MEKENKRHESDFSENEIPDLNSLKPFEFEPKQTSEILTVSSSSDDDEGAEYKVKRIINNEWCECSAKVQCKSSRWQMFFKIGVKPATLLKRDSNTGVFLRKPLFLQNTSTLIAASGSKQCCKPMNTYTKSLSCRKKKWYTWTVFLWLVFLDNEYSFEVFQTLLTVPPF